MRLSRTERDELTALLESHNPDGPLAGSITALHGFCSAVVSGPMVMPSDWLPLVFGGEDDRTVGTEQQARRALDLLMRFYNEIATELDRGDRYRVLLDRFGDPPHTYFIVERWCEGYLYGMSLRASEWLEAMSDDELSLAFAPIASIQAPEMSRDLRRKDPKAYLDLIDALPTAVFEIHRWWRRKLTSDAASERAHQTVHRTAPKVSPNAPCPCGSGKKYKRCCSPHAQPSAPPVSPRARQARRVWKITIRLRHVMPIVWRTIMVRPETKLIMLHRYIQAAMGWSDYHLFAFKIGGREYGIPHPDFRDIKVYDARRYTLERLFPNRPTSFEYVYDFGDNWEHLIEIEQEEDALYRQRYPICIAGAEPCPPEDCGGPGRWAELRSVLNNPNHADHAEILAWTRSQAHRNYFDPKFANWDLREIGV
jgi:yecA family protein